MADVERDVLSPTTDAPASVTDSPGPDDGSNQQPTVFHIPRVAARTITGPANLQNQGAIDWGYHGLLAYGSNYAVVVIDTKNIQPIQCLDRHKSMVNKVLWQRSTLDNAVSLASSDTSGHIVVWDVAEAEPRVVLQDGTKPILDMAWLSGYDSGEHMLAAIHPPHTLVIWDTRSGTKVWKKMYAETLLTLDVDPFSPSNIAFLCPDCILIAEDISLTRPPPSLGRKFYVSSPRAGAVAGGVSGEERQRTADRLRRLMRDVTVAEAKPKPDDSVSAGDCLQLRYHRSARHHLLALFARELVVLDLHIGQAVAVVPLEKTASPFQQVVSARQRDVLYCLHESGSVSVKLRRRANAGAASPLDAAPGSISSLDAAMSDDALMEYGYEQRCVSEMIRLSKGSRVLGMALNPCTERRVALVASTGMVVFAELAAAHAAPPPPWTELIDGPPPPGIRAALPSEVDVLEDLFGPLTWEGSPSAPPLRLPVTGMLRGVSAPITALRMCPPLTTRNWTRYRPLMAAATAAGAVQIYDMAAGIVQKELSIHSCVIRGIEWTGLNSFLTHAHPAVTGGQLLVRNEVMHTNVLTGHSVMLRLNKGEESPIAMLRASPLKQYFIVVLKDGPFELWDLRNHCLLRVMPRKMPNIVALEWASIHNLKSLKKRTAGVAASDSDAGATAGDSVDRSTFTCEHFVFSDTESQLHHFSAEGNVFRDSIKIPPEAGVGTVTCLAFKNDQIVQADADGVLNLWDLRARTSRNVSTGRGAIKKMRFAPGKGNLKLLVLFNDGVDVVDLKRHFERIGQLRTPKDMVKIMDIDWAASDKPVLATQDGCLRIMDMTLSTSASPIADCEFQDPVFCPGLLAAPTLDKLQLLLSRRPPRDRQGLHHTVEDGVTEEERDALESLQQQLEEPQRLAFSTRTDTAQRSLMVARLLGDATGADFWVVALYYLHAARLGRRDSGSFESNLGNRLPPLDTSQDTFADGTSFTRRQLERAAVHESKRRDHAQTRRVVEQLVLLGETDRAVRLLLETDIAHPAYYADAVKACLVATIQASGAAQSTIKLVATNLIANGSVPEGVQLLCLIGKGLDASRYLLSYAMWDPAVWLAKVALAPSDADEVLRKWADHMWANGQKEKAVLAALMTGRPLRVLEMLELQGLRTRATLYRAACIEFGVLPVEAAEACAGTMKVCACTLR